jgi:hypothetical protein
MSYGATFNCRGGANSDWALLVHYLQTNNLHFITLTDPPRYGPIFTAYLHKNHTNFIYLNNDSLPRNSTCGLLYSTILLPPPTIIYQDHTERLLITDLKIDSSNLRLISTYFPPNIDNQSPISSLSLTNMFPNIQSLIDFKPGSSDSSILVAERLRLLINHFTSNSSSFNSSIITGDLNHTLHPQDRYPVKFAQNHFIHSSPLSRLIQNHWFDIYNSIDSINGMSDNDDDDINFRSTHTYFSPDLLNSSRLDYALIKPKYRHPLHSYVDSSMTITKVNYDHLPLIFQLPFTSIPPPHTSETK